MLTSTLAPPTAFSYSFFDGMTTYPSSDSKIAGFPISAWKNAAKAGAAPAFISIKSLLD